MNFQTALNESFQSNASHIAIDSATEKISYESLLREAKKITQFLLSQDLGQETIIGIDIEDRADLICAIIGVINARCVFVPLDRTLPEARLENILHNLNLNYLITSDNFQEKFKTKQSLQVWSWEEVTANTEGTVNIEAPSYSANDSIYIYFTSGSTGTPKGILGRNGSLLQFLQWEMDTFHIGAKARISQFISPYFDAFLRDIFLPLLSGGTICIPPNDDDFFSPGKLVPWIDQQEISHIHCVPSLFRMIDADFLKDTYFQNLKYVFMSGEKIVPASLKHWYEIFADRIQLVNFYGLTETTMIRSYYEISPSDVKKSRMPIGIPINDTELLIAKKDFKANSPLVPGELFIVTDYPTKGYLNNPELTHEKFLKYNQKNSSETIAFKTGDKARKLLDGNIDLIGREDRQIKLRGIRIELDEIESQLTQSGLIEAAVVIPHKDENENESLLAFVLKKNPSDEEATLLTGLRQYLFDQVPAYMMPSDIILLDAFPLLPNGKVNYKGLREFIRPERIIIAPTNSFEENILRVWKEILGDKEISIDDTFHQIGGNSLTIMSLISKLNKVYGVRISLSELFKNPTIRQQAQLLSKAGKEQELVIPKANKSDYYAMTSSQKSMFFLQEFDNTSIAYNMTEVFQLEGNLNRERINLAFNKLLERQACLRTSFSIINGEPRQIVADTMNFEVEYKKADAAEAEVLIKEFVRPFDFSQAPLMRAGIISTSEKKHLLIVDIHHIITDGTSGGLLVKDFMSFYQGEEPEALPLHYTDFAEWQASESRQKALEAQKQFWTDTFSELPPPLELPADFVRPEMKSHEGRVTSFQINAANTKHLETLAKEEDVTLYMLLMAIFNVFIGKLGKTEDVVVGSPTAGRLHQDLENIVGMFANTLPIRNYPLGHLSFKELLASVKTNVLAAFDNQEYPLLHLLHDLKFERDSTRNPLFDTLFSYQNYQQNELELSGLTLSPYKREQQVSKLDLAIYAQKIETGIVFDIEYSTALFKDSTIEQFKTCFKEIAQAIIYDVEVKINAIHTSSSKKKRTLNELEQKLQNEWKKVLIDPSHSFPSNGTTTSSKAFQPQQFWLEEFSQKPQNLVLPTDYSRLSKKGNKRGAKNFRINATETARLKSLARSTGSSLFGVLLSAYYTLLSRLSTQEEILVDSSLSGKNRENFEPRVESSFNTLPIRIVSEGTWSIQKLVETVSTQAQACLHNQGYILEALAEESDTNHELRSQVLFNFGQFEEAFSLPNEQANLKQKSRLADTEMDLWVYEHEDEIHCQMGCDTALYKPQTINRYISYFQKIVSSLVQGIEIPLCEIDILSTVEKQKVSEGFNQTKGDYSSHKTIIDKYRIQLAENPDNLALSYKDKQLSYQELEVRSNQYAQYLIDSYDIKPGDFVGLLLERELELVPVIFGILKTGAAYVPLNSQNPIDRIQEIVEEAQVKVIVSRSGLEELIPSDKVSCLNLDTELAKVLEKSKKAVEVNIPSDSLAYVIFTSGTTGKPKGVMIEHHSVINRLEWMQKEYPISAEDVLLQKTPISFDVSVWELFWWSFEGASLTLLGAGEEKEPAEIIKTIERDKVTTLHFVPSMLSMFLAEVERISDDDALASLKQVFCSGEALKASYVQQFGQSLHWQHQTRLINLYGPTEATVDVSYYECDFSDEENNIPIGKPIANTQLYILDKYGQLLPPGITGELHIGGVGLARGYVNREELTREKFVKSEILGGKRLYKTGDLAAWREDGNIMYLGRIDHQIKLRGNRIELSEIEFHLSKHEEIRESVVLAKGEGVEQFLVAYYISEEKLNRHELRAMLGNKLPGYMIPDRFIHMTRFPLSPNGKLNRAELPLPALEIDEDFSSPRNNTEAILVNIWAEVLGLDAAIISTDQSFFLLGGHSLSSIKMAAKVFEELGATVSVKDIFDHSDIIGLAQLIDNSPKSRGTALEKASQRAHYPLSDAQQPMYFLHEFDPESLVRNLTRTVKIEGALEVEHLSKAFEKLIERHESLRTSFVVVHEAPVQIIDESVEFKLHRFTASEKEIYGILDEFVRPFDLTNSPLFKVGLIEIEPTVHILILDIHHLIADGQSIDILVQDFLSLYNQQELPKISYQYRDFAEWQRTVAYQDDLAKQKEFWLQEFNEEIVPLEVPLDFEKPSTESMEGGLIELSIGEEQTRELHELAKAEGTTLAMVMLSLFYILLSKIARQEDIVVGVPQAGRENRSFLHTVGMFAKVLPIRSYPKSEIEFGQFLKEVTEKFLAAYENQLFPYGTLAKELNIQRQNARNPWFDVMFSYEHFKSAGMGMGDLRVTPFKGENFYTEENLTLNAFEDGNEIHLQFAYSKALFKEKTVARFIGYFRKIIEASLADPHVLLSEIEIVKGEEKERIFSEFNDTKQAIDRNKMFSALFREQVRKTPDREAVRYQDESLTYQELYDRSVRMASYLKSRGMKPQMKVALFMPRSIEMLSCMLATFHVGGVYVPLDVSYPVKRIQTILEDAKPEFLITHLTEEESLNEILKSLPQVQLVTDIVNMDLSVHSPKLILQGRHVDDLAYIIYTSGTTGNPKGAMIHQLGMVNHIQAKINDLNLTQEDIIAQTASPCFDISIWQFLAALLVGGKTQIVDKDTLMDPEALIQELCNTQVSIFESVPSLITSFLDGLPSELPFSLEHLRWMIPTGEALHVSLVRKWYHYFPNIKLLNAYGPTEASDDVTHYVVEYPSENQVNIPIGKPIQNTHIYILDKNLKLCPIGVQGEICVAGLGVGKGYWLNEEKTKQAFVPNPFWEELKDEDYKNLYKTGDIGYFQEDGNIVCLGRIDQQIKIRGNRIEIEEIEAKLRTYPGISDVVVLAQGETIRKFLVAYYVSLQEVSSEDLRNYILDQLPDYMVPSVFLSLEKMPLTSNGKLNRKALPKAEISFEASKYVAPSNKEEEMLQQIWAEVLGVEPSHVSVEANYFELGGNSLMAISLINRIQQSFGVKVPIREFFTHPFIHATARFIQTDLLLQKMQTSEGATTTEIII